MDAINQLLAHQFEEEIYHSDGYGHVQVQSTATYDFGCAPAELLDQIEQTGQWQRFFLSIAEQPDSWLLALSNHLPLGKPYSISILVELLQRLHSRDSRMILIQESPMWSWRSQHILQLQTVLNILQKLIDETTPTQQSSVESNDFGYEIEISMLNDIALKLANIKQRSTRPVSQ